MKQAVAILWLEDIDPAKLEAVPSLSALLTSGADLRLAPLPLTEKGQCYYQTLTGVGPAKFGRFDAVRPETYQSFPNMSTPDGTLGLLLPDLLRSKKLVGDWREITSVNDLSTLTTPHFDFALIRLLKAGSFTPKALDAIVSRFLELAAAATHIFVLTDVWSSAPHTLVNINDFFADTGLLEVNRLRRQAHIVWSETLAYGLGSGQIWINLRGREAQGVVGTGREYQEVCEALVHELRHNWLDPRTNEPVVEQVYKKEEIYSGEYLFKAPDLVTVYRPGYAPSARAVALDLDGTSVSPAESPFQAQTPYARLIAYGPALAQTVSKQAALIDVVPTLIYLLGLPIPQRIDGEVITGIFTQAHLAQHPVTRIDDTENMLSDDEEGLIVDRLRDLGYLG